MTPKSFIQMLQARVGGFRSLSQDDRNVPAKQEKPGKWIIHRGSNADKLFAENPQAQEPLSLVNGGTLELYLRIARKDEHTEIVSYRIAVQKLPANDNEIVSLRYDKSAGKPGGHGWEDDLDDNPEHPWAHLHVNFDRTLTANNCRLPTGEVSPIVLLAAFDHWYFATFGA